MPSPIDLALFHNYRERSQMSMLLYAERLGAALERRGLPVTRVRVRDVFPRWALRSRTVDKLDSYAGRFLRYPLVARRQRGEVFHVVDHGQGYLVRHLDPARTVVTCHDLILLVLASGRMGSGFAPPLATRVLRASVREMERARRIVADSESTRRDLLSLSAVDPDRVSVIHPGLNFSYAPDPAAGAAFRLAYRLGSGPLLLQVGQTGFYKNLPGCLRVVANLRAGGLPVSLVRAGHPLRPEHLELAQRLGISEHIRDLGPLTDQGIADLYNAADVLLFPSLYEGFGWPPLEAMASGLPVVCSRAGSLGEIVGDGALTADPEDVSGLSNHVASILTDPYLAASLRERGLERARLFDWDRTAEKFEAVYREVLEG
jgi:glycosyltransferase involved in cell wall biosynthesis